MQNLITLSLLLSLFILSNCSGSDSLSLKNNETITSVFSDPEIEDLQIILDFFTEKICHYENGNLANPSECYNHYTKQLNETAPTSGVMEIPIDYDEQLQMYDKLNSDVFYEIWRTNDRNKHELTGINIMGKYSEFLMLFGKDDDAIKVYHENLMRTGVIGVFNQSDMLLFPEKYNNEDIRIRLVVAIHYLTLNDKYLRTPGD